MDDMDILIAGITRAHHRVVVTDNTTRFGMLPGVDIEEWSSN